MKGKYFSLLIQGIKFAAVGASNTIISFVLYYILVFLGFHYLVANGIGFFVSVINSFFWNNRFVFKDKHESSLPKSFIKVFVSYFITFVLQNVLLYVFVDIIGLSSLIAPIISLFITIPLNFILNKFWAFKDK